jgi:hypothetical protein
MFTSQVPGHHFSRRDFGLFNAFTFNLSKLFYYTTNNSPSALAERCPNGYRSSCPLRLSRYHSNSSNLLDLFQKHTFLFLDVVRGFSSAHVPDSSNLPDLIQINDFLSPAFPIVRILQVFYRSLGVDSSPDTKF